MIMPTADYIFKKDEHLVVVGETEKWIKYSDNQNKFSVKKKYLTGS